MLTLFFALLFIPGFSQDPVVDYISRRDVSVKKEKLQTANSIGDLTPELWQKLGMRAKERLELERRRKITFPLGSFTYPAGGYETAIDYVSVEISAISNGKTVTVKNRGGQLNAEQKALLNAADIGTDLVVMIDFRYKPLPGDDAGNKIINSALWMTVVPDTEAEYPGGFVRVTDYLNENIVNKFSRSADVQQVRKASVKFIVDEEGRVVAPKMEQTSANEKIDRLILDVISKMPGWKPARNSKGVKVKQEFCIRFGGDNC